ncbi:MAG: thioredoxin domain-containing protein, partial [Terriglobales bacterium]
GLPSFGRLLSTMAAAWRDDRPRLLAAANGVSDYLAQALSPAVATAEEAASPAALLAATWPKLMADLQSSYDAHNGGFGAAPKFPRPVAHAFLLRYAKLRAGASEAEQALAMVTASLRAMASGGLHDHLAGGFHRYTVDGGWRVPHFEKMLYDQAQLAASFIEAWQLTHADDLAASACQTCDFVLHEMTSPEGGFYSAQDADSPVPEKHREENGPREGEGAYYLWTREEIGELLPQEDAELFCRAYGVTASGNVAAALDPQGEFSGKNILYIADEKAHRDPRLVAARALVYAERRQRPLPPTDTKILTAWNGLMISALAQTAAALDEPSYLAAAKRAAAYIEQSRWSAATNRLRRTAEVDGFAEDYAFLIQGLLDLHQASFDAHWLEWARQLQRVQEELFAAPDGSYYSSQPDPGLLLRLREDYDGAEPSPNSVAVSNLLRLALWYENEDWRERAEAVTAAFAAKLREMPQALPLLCAHLEAAAAPPRRLMIAGDAAADDTHALLAVARRHFLPGYWIVPAPAPPGGHAAAYLCEDYTCQLPVTTVAELENALR